MRNRLLFFIFLVFAICSCNCNCQQKESSLPSNHKDVIRVGQIVKLKPECIEKYKELHADGNSGVRHLLTKYNIRNFSIFLQQFPDGNWYEFGYYEYWGDDLEADMAKLNAEPENSKWLEMCDPMQEGVFPEDKGWKRVNGVYFNY